MDRDVDLGIPRRQPELGSHTYVDTRTYRREG